MILVGMILQFLFLIKQKLPNYASLLNYNNLQNRITCHFNYLINKTG
jgi:hypothetical protein